MKKRDKVRVLSLDGGGIRGVIPAMVLVHIESKIKAFSKNPDAQISDYFDMIVGTSTGAILAAFLLVPGEDGRPKYTARDGYNFYKKEGYGIFNQSLKQKYSVMRLLRASKYSEKKLESILDEKLEEVKMSDLLRPCVITAYDLYSQSSYFFNSRDSERKGCDFYVKDVLRSTSAAPTYFNPARIKSIPIRGESFEMMNIDGGVFANNPAMCAYSEARRTKFENWQDKDYENKAFPTARNLIMLSIGTGGGYVQFKQPESAHRWSMLDWAKQAPNIMMDGGLDTVSYHIAKLYGSLDKLEDRLNYKRIDYPAMQKGLMPPYATDMADASPRNIRQLQDAGELTILHANAKREGERTLDDFILNMVQCEFDAS